MLCDLLNGIESQVQHNLLKPRSNGAGDREILLLIQTDRHFGLSCLGLKLKFYSPHYGICINRFEIAAHQTSVGIHQLAEVPLNLPKSLNGLVSLIPPVGSLS